MVSVANRRGVSASKEEDRRRDFVQSSFSSASSSSSSPVSSSSSAESVDSAADSDVDGKHGPDGFYRVRRGEILSGRYRVDFRLGQGHFSQVWSCKDLHASHQHSDVAVKIVKSAERYRVVVEHEVSLLNAAVKAGKAVSASPEVVAADGEHRRCAKWSLQSRYVLRLLETFELASPYGGVHPCLVFERLGPSLLHLARYCTRRRLPAPVTRAVARDVLRGLDFLQSQCSIVHTDVKPENILIRIERSPRLEDADAPAPKRRRVGDAGENGTAVTEMCEEKGKQKNRIRDTEKAERRTVLETTLGAILGVEKAHSYIRVDNGAANGKLAECNGVTISFCLADFGNGCFVDSLRSGRGTCQYKPPEVLLGAGYDTSADLWSLGCTLYECAAGRYLIDPRYVGRRRRSFLGTGSDGQLPESVPRDEEHLAQLFEIFAPLPETLARRGRKTKHLLRCRPDSRNPHTGEGAVCRWVLRRMRVPLDRRPRHGGLAGRLRRRAPNVTYADDLLGLISDMLRPEPFDRPCARALLTNAFLRPSP